MKAKLWEFPKVFWLGIAGLMVASCSREKESAPAARGKPDVLLVTLDTTRADFLSCYGGPAGTTPTIDRVAKEGLRFANCYTTAPITLPAHATIMTGLQPFQHQLRDNGAGVLDEKAVTLAELFRGGGYRTGAFIGAYVLHSRYGLNQGFEVYGDEFQGVMPAHMHDGTEFAERNAKDVSDAAIGWLDAKDDRPFFVWTHYFDPHAPYAAPGRPPGGEVRAEYAAEIKFVDAEWSRVLARAEARSKAAGRELLVIITADHGEGLGDHGEDTHGFFTYNSTLHVPLIVRGPGVPGGQISQVPVSLVDLYPTLVAWLGFTLPNSVLGQTLPTTGGRVSERPLYFETRIPFHTYGWSPLEGVISASDKLIAAPTAELYDLAADPAEKENRFAVRRERATELAAKLEEVKAPREGVPVLSVQQQTEDVASLRKLRSLGYVSTPGDVPGGELKLPDPKDLMWLRPKLMEAERLLAAGDAKGAAVLREVFAADSNNIKALNLVIEHLRSPQARGLLIPVAQSRALAPLYPPYDLELPAYLGAALCRNESFEEGLEVIGKAEGIDKRSLIPKVARAECLELAGRGDEVLPMWEAMLLEDPKDPIILRTMGDVYAKKNDPARAAEFYSRSIAVKDSDGETHAKLGTVLRFLGRPAEAVQELRRALQLSPELVAIHSELGSLLLEQGNAAEAAQEYARFVAARPELPQAHYDLGVALTYSNNPAKAAEEFRETLRLSPGHGDAWVNLGIALLQQGQAKEGLDALSKATQIESVAGAAHLNLAIAAKQAGDQQGVIDHLEKGASSNPPSIPALKELITVYVRQGRYDGAVRVLRAGLQSSPGNPELLHYLASILATCPDDSIRDGKEALRLAELAVGPRRPAHPVLLNTLAAAQAETGDFEAAVRTVNEALAVQHPAALGEILKRQLELFRSGQPSRDLRLIQVY